MRTKVNHKVRKGDLVEVLSGAERGKRGRVFGVRTEEGRVVVEGIRKVWKHMRRTQRNPQSGRVEQEAPIDISNVMVVSEETETPQRLRVVSFRDERGKTQRYRVGVKDGKPVSARDKELAEKHGAKG